MELKREIAEREARVERDWLKIDHRAALRAAHAELAPVRDEVDRLREAHARAQLRLADIGAASTQCHPAMDCAVVPPGRRRVALDGADRRRGMDARRAAWRRLHELRAEFGDEIDRFEMLLRVAEGAGLPAITELDTFRAGLARFVAWLDKPRPRRARG
jgi:hypothetical protein